MTAIYLIEQNQWLAVSLVALIGAVIGSFITLVTYRLPRDEPIIRTRSCCPHCHTRLSVRDLIPILSWVVRKGRCRHCRKAVSLRYPLTEIAAAVGAALIVWHFGLTLSTFALCGLWWSALALIVTDLEHYIILDELQIAAALFGLLYAHALAIPFAHVLLTAVAGIALGLLLKYGFIFFAKKDGLGMGDVKFLGVAGIWLAAPESFIPFLFFSGVLGVVLGLIWRALGHGERFPFGPALAAALLVCVLWPELPRGYWELYGMVQPA